MSDNEEYTSVRLQSKVYDRIEKEVVALYKKLHINEIPIKPFKIASQLGFVVKEYSSLSRKVLIELKTKEQEGVSHYDPELGTFVIYYDDTITYSRIRFTIMHEIGHILLGHREESVLAKRMADYFAAYSLAPSPLMDLFNCEDYIDVSDKFDVSPECADNCFDRFTNWTYYGGKIKPYEVELLDLFQK